MQSASPLLTLGYINYLNCVPFFALLKEQGFQGNLVAGVPSELNHMLQQGEIDASPSSSFEYARNWRDYLILPGHSISSIGSIASVLLFSPVSPEHLNGVEIALTGESATSVNLLKVLLLDHYRLTDVVTTVPGGSVEALVEKNQPALLIGDRALKLAASAPVGVGIYDLGKIWHQHTGLPFVFALWMIRQQALLRHDLSLQALALQLLKSRETVLKNPYRFAVPAARGLGLNPDEIVRYWLTVDYRLEREHLDGLTLFFERCVARGLLNEMPLLNFYKGSPSI